MVEPTRFKNTLCSSNLDHFPNFHDENKKIFRTTTECLSCGCCETPRSKADLDDGQQLNTLLHGQIVRLIGFLPCILLENTSRFQFWADMFTKNHCIWWFWGLNKYVTKVDKVIKITVDFQHQSYIRSVGLMFYYFLVSDGHFLTLVRTRLHIAWYQSRWLPLLSHEEPLQLHDMPRKCTDIFISTNEKDWHWGYLKRLVKLYIIYLCNCWYSYVSILLWYRPTVTIL